MRIRFFIAIALTAALTILYASSKVASNPSQIEITGSVWNSAGEPLGGVRIQAYRNGKMVGETTSAPDPKRGLYVLRIDADDEAFGLTYSKFGLANDAVPNLSGRANHCISEVMFRKDEGNPQIKLATEFADQYLKSMQSIEPIPRN